MRIEYASNKVMLQCNSIKEASKLFGGDARLTKSLLGRINELSAADVLQDIIVQKKFRFHNLENRKGNNLKDYFAIDVKSITDPWRIIFQPLNENSETYNPCHIDEIAKSVRNIRIKEVSKHYE